MQRHLIAFLLLVATGAAPASAMSVNDFLIRAAALEKKGVTALFTDDYKLLRAEVKGAGDALRASQKTARAAGRTPIACLPENKVPVKSDELLAYFRAIPPARRSMTVAAAFTEMMRKKYPCAA